MRRVRFLTLTQRQSKEPFRIFKNPKRMFGRKARGLFNRKCWKVKGKVGEVKLGQVRMVPVRKCMDGFLTLGVRNPSIRASRKSRNSKGSPSLPRKIFKTFKIFKIGDYRGDNLGSNKMLLQQVVVLSIEGFLTLRVRNPSITGCRKSRNSRGSPSLPRKTFKIF